MKMSVRTVNIIVEMVCLLYILLFIYAALSKLLDFENFQLQVAQSPLLTAYAGFFSCSVIALEIVIAVLLSIPALRLAGMFAAFTLMVLFTVYIFIILNYSPYVPCSCGGILEKMGWKEHLVFNLAFVFLGATGIVLKTLKKDYSRFYIPIMLTVLTIGSILIMFLLFVVSEETLHHRNNFVRRIPPFAVDKLSIYDLKYNSYYLAGADSKHIFLGNHTAPSVVTVLDSTLNKQEEFHITLDDTISQFTSIEVKINPPYFYVYDGSIPRIYSGYLTDWKAKLRMKNVQRFLNAVPIDHNIIAFRAATTTYGNLLGIFEFGDDVIVKYKYGLLEKQIDGFFDTDGMMYYSAQSKRFVYLYYYRNQYVVTDEHLNLIHRANTIDTTTRAKIKIKYLDKKKEKKFGAPPLVVNRKSTLHNNLLFVNSMLPGKYDPLEMWEQASIVDVYNINEGSYLMSFYVYKVDGKQMNSFIVTDTHLFALFDRKIVSYRLSAFLLKEFDKNQ